MFAKSSKLDNLDAIQKSRYQFARALVVTVFLSSLGGILAQTFVIIQAQIDGQATIVGIGTTVMLSCVCVVLWFLLQRGAIEFVVAVLSLLLAGFTLFFSDIAIGIFLAILAIITASTLRRNLIYGIATGIILSKVIYDIVVIVQESGLEIREDGLLGVVLLGSYITLSVAIRLLVGTAQKTAEEAQRASVLLRTTSDISQITARLLDLNELFKRSVELIRERFDYYHVQIFLVDDNREYAKLVASTGEIGQMLLERQHRIAIGSTSVIGRVTQIGEPVVARDADSQSDLHARNELLPNTRSELAVAITDGERIIGALDVQSTASDAFQPIDIQTLQVVANQLGIAIRNARLFETQSASVQENKRLFFESEANLREIQRLNRQLTRKVWGDYLLDKGDISGIALDKHDPIPQKEVAWTPRMIEASQRRRPSVGVAESGESAPIAVPIVLRGEVIGAIEVYPASETRQDDAIEVVQAVAQRLALSLDNARLFQETQLNVQQQQAINEIVGKFQSAVNVDELLEMTLTEVGEMIGAEMGTIRLGSTLTQSDVVFSKDNNNGGTPHDARNAQNAFWIRAKTPL